MGLIVVFWETSSNLTNTKGFCDELTRTIFNLFSIRNQIVVIHTYPTEANYVNLHAQAIAINAEICFQVVNCATICYKRKEKQTTIKANLEFHFYLF